MSLFNFNSFEDEENDEFDEYREIKCQCDNCSINHTLDIVENFTNDILNAQDIEQLQEILYQFAEFSKIQGVKEYLYETIRLQQDTLYGLDIYTDSVLQHDEKIEDEYNEDAYGNTDIPHWRDRL